MTPVYILLTIIAIGVLLASESGKKLLGVLTTLIFIGGLLYMGFWIIIVAIAFFSSETGKSFADWGGFIISWGLILWGVYFVIKTLKNKKGRNDLWERTKENLIKNKGKIIFWSAVFLFVFIFIMICNFTYF